MNKKNIILDLDETLINANYIEDFDTEEYKRLYGDTLSQSQNPFEFKVMQDIYIVFKRPHLDQFLDYIFENFNVSVWTAASKDYALWIIKNYIIKDTNRKLDFIFWSYHCTFSHTHGKGSKDLSLIWKKFQLSNYNKNNTIIIDDNPEVFNIQPGRVIPAIEFSIFHYNLENDRFLLDIIPILEEYKNIPGIPNESIENFTEANDALVDKQVEEHKNRMKELKITAKDKSSDTDSIKSNLTDIVEDINADVETIPDTDSESESAGIEVDNESKGTDVEVIPDTDSESESADVEAIPDTDSESESADVEAIPDTDSESEDADVEAIPDTDSESESADVEVIPDTDSDSDTKSNDSESVESDQ